MYNFTEEEVRLLMLYFVLNSYVWTVQLAAYSLSWLLMATTHWLDRINNHFYHQTQLPAAVL
jgi:phage shock protein PspC (stress-responsive transcriptional regulator)